MPCVGRGFFLREKPNFLRFDVGGPRVGSIIAAQGRVWRIGERARMASGIWRMAYRRKSAYGVWLMAPGTW